MTANIMVEPQEEDLQSREKRLKAVLDKENNRSCAECPELEPTWACLLFNPLGEDGGPRLGILCCYKCYGNHFRLGKDVGKIKSTRRANEWTEEEVAILEISGNQVVNGIYEAKLPSEARAAVQEDMETFVQNKYKELKYFSKKTFQQHFKANSNNKLLKLKNPTFDWRAFSKKSDDNDLDAPSTHSAAATPKKRGRGISRAISNPFALEKMRTGLLDSSRHTASAEQPETTGEDPLSAPPPTNLNRSSSNPFFTGMSQTMSKMKTGLLDSSRHTTSAEQTETTDEDPLPAPPNNPKKSSSNPFLTGMSQTVSKMMGTSSHGSSGAATDICSQESQPEDPEQERKDRRRTGVKKQMSNPYDLLAMSRAIDDDGDGEEDEEDDRSYMNVSSRRSPARRGVRRADSNPCALGFMRREVNDVASDDASVGGDSVSGRSRIGKFLRSGRGGSASRLGSTTRRSLLDDDDDDASQSSFAARPRHSRPTRRSLLDDDNDDDAPDSSIARSSLLRNEGFLGGNDDEEEAIASDARPSLHFRQEPNNRGLLTPSSSSPTLLTAIPTEFGMTQKIPKSKQSKLSPMGLVAIRKHVGAHTSTKPTRFSRARSLGEPDNSNNMEAGLQTPTAKPTRFSRTKSLGFGEPDNGKEVGAQTPTKPTRISRASSLGDVDKSPSSRRHKPSLVTDLSKLDDDEEEDDKKKKTRTSRSRRLVDDNGKSDSLDRSIRGSTRGERSSRDKSSRGERSNIHRATSDDSDKKSGRRERTRDRKDARRISGNSPRRKSDGTPSGEKRSPRRTATDRSERKSPKPPMCRQMTTPAKNITDESNVELSTAEGSSRQSSFSSIGELAVKVEDETGDLESSKPLRISRRGRISRSPRRRTKTQATENDCSEASRQNSLSSIGGLGESDNESANQGGEQPEPIRRSPSRRSINSQASSRGSRRRSSGEQPIRRSSSGTSINSDASSKGSRRRSSGKKRLEETTAVQGIAKAWRRSSEESSTAGIPERNPKPIQRQHSRRRAKDEEKNSNKGQKVKQGVTELASLIIMTQEMSDRSVLSSATKDISNSSLGYLCPDSPGSTASGSNADQERPSSPTREKEKDGNGEAGAIHSLRSPSKSSEGPHFHVLRSPSRSWRLGRIENFSVPQIDLMQDGASCHSRMDGSCHSRKVEAESADNQKEKRKRHTKSSKTRRSKASKSPKRSKDISASERNSRTSRRSRNSSSHKRSGKSAETLQDTIMALHAINQTKMTADKSCGEPSLQPSQIIGS